MSFFCAALLCLTSGFATGDMSLEESVLATLPEGMKLTGEPITGPDGKQYPVEQRVVWSPDGKQVAYVGLREGKSFPVLGEQVFDSYHFAGTPAFDPTGKHVVFRVGNRKKNNKSEEWWLLTEDGKVQFKQDWMGVPAFSPDGNRLAIWTQPGAKIAADGSYTRGSLIFHVGENSKGKWKFKKGKKFEDARALLPPVFTPDGETVATIASRDQRWLLLTATGKRQRPAAKDTYTVINDFALAPNGKDFALVVTAGSQPDFELPTGMTGMTLPGMNNEIVYGKERYGKAYDNVGVPVFSPNGKTLVYKVKRGDKMGLATNGDRKANTNHDFVYTPVFSPDSKKFCYVATEGGELSEYFSMSSNGEWSIQGGTSTLFLEDSKRKGKPEALSEEYLEIRDVTWSPDGERVAYRARTEEGWLIVCGDQRSEVYAEVGAPNFSADGSHLAHGARVDRDLWWKVLALE